MTPKFTNKKVDALSAECGIVIDTENQIVTSHEIEFFIDKLIEEMICMVGKIEPDYLVAELESWKSNRNIN